jgi:hypothetical protein
MTEQQFALTNCPPGAAAPREIRLQIMNRPPGFSAIAALNAARARASIFEACCSGARSGRPKIARYATSGVQAFSFMGNLIPGATNPKMYMPN